MLTSKPNTTKQIDETSKRTLQRKKIFKKKTEKNSGSSEAAFNRQTGLLMRTLSRDQRSQILKSAKIRPIKINAEEMFAMKVDRGIL